MNDKAFMVLVAEIRDACNRYLDAKPVSAVLAGVESKPTPARKPSVKGNPRCRCGHGYTVHAEPRDNSDGKPENICAGCEADGSKIGCPEFVKKGTLPVVAGNGVAHESVERANDEFSAVEIAILDALNANSQRGWTAQQIAILSVYVQSGTFNSAIGDLRELGLIEGSPLLQLTPTGKVAAAAHDLDRKYTAKALRAAWSQKLPATHAKIIEVLAAYGPIASSAQLADLCKYAQSGTFNSAIGQMRRKGMIAKKLPLRLCPELS